MYFAASPVGSAPAEAASMIDLVTSGVAPTLPMSTARNEAIFQARWRGPLNGVCRITEHNSSVEAGDRAVEWAAAQLLAKTARP